jgi:alpha,alpha-trehalose phosphorylase
MIGHPAFLAEEWSIRQKDFSLDLLAQTESLFALSNGHIGLRGNLDEGEPYAFPGTYLNSVYELHPLPYAEMQYGSPESGQTVINVTNGKLIRLLVGDEPFDIRYGKVEYHERELDMRAGVLRRSVCWNSPVGHKVKVSSVRMVSFKLRSIAAISYEVEILDAPAQVVIQSELVANEEQSGASKDPRSTTILTPPLVSEECLTQGTTGLLIHHTQISNLRIGAAVDHSIEGTAQTTTTSECTADVTRLTVTALLKPGERIRIVKFIAYGWSSERSRAALHDQVLAALSSAKLLGWDGLLVEQRAYLDRFWNTALVEIEGDPEIQQAVRFALFHVLQAASRGERRPIPAKGLTGTGYEGHAFWDTEIYVLPVLTLTYPNAAADALRWRYSTLDLAKKRAQQFGLNGAAFPWRTIHGEECSGYWPASTAAVHINADIAYAVVKYIEATGDTAFEEEIGLELLVETARLWLSLGHCAPSGQFRIDDVTGPDEYSALMNCNVYTNLMARQNLRAAGDAAQRHPEKAKALNVDDTEIEHWYMAAEKMDIPYDQRLGVTPQAEAFTDLNLWDFAHTPSEKYPLFLHYPYFDLYRKQVIKQADLVLAMLLCGDAFTAEQKARNFAYYEPLTVRDSSLSACIQAIIAAEVWQVQLAYDYLGEAALMDLDNLEHNVQDGVHIASLAGSWMALVMGLGGMRMHGKALSFAPRLPQQITRIAFRLLFRGRNIHVEAKATEAAYQLLDGAPLTVKHYGDEITLSVGETVTRPIEAKEAGPRPTQPVGRVPITRQTRRSGSKQSMEPSDHA